MILVNVGGVVTVALMVFIIVTDVSGGGLIVNISISAGGSGLHCQH